jgi:ribonuclease P protein component
MTQNARPLPFPQTHRMKTPAEFERCYARKRSASDGVLIVYACENDLAHPRLGCSVSRKVGNAVVRNRYKRLFREAFRLSQHELPSGVDLILIPRPGPAPALDAVRASLVKLAQQAARKLGARGKPTPPAPLPEGKGEFASSPSPLAGEGGGASPPGEGALRYRDSAKPTSGAEVYPSPGSRREPPSPARGEGENKDPGEGASP